eukprot:1130518-Pleurochrysis_carterae.AAC.1
MMRHMNGQACYAVVVRAHQDTHYLSCVHAAFLQGCHANCLVRHHRIIHQPADLLYSHAQEKPHLVEALNFLLLEETQIAIIESHVHSTSCLAPHHTSMPLIHAGCSGKVELDTVADSQVTKESR